ncbi:phage portal protein [Terrihabitans rhizophilus]|uniref:Phage portal protein n=1 Tax=Terrihabitans rhizophilus TaxID=3092662 RepID=A0ABU4RND1_9HYPH|nr:phage portal protein [Terrihabitans sp. PJ23]MDX6806324.1 phage portal protein [Terrihabitans sp. PJ23]
MVEAKPRYRVPARSARDVEPLARPNRPTARYLRPDRSGILGMRRAVTRDAKVDVLEAAERASALALDFMQNSGWLAGAADQIISDTIGTELKLNARPDLAALGYTEEERSAWCRIVEAQWRRYAWNPAECDLAGKSTVAEMLDAVVRHYLAYGEAFGVFDYLTVRRRRTLGLETGTKVSLVAPHRLPRTTREFEGLEQGIYHDALGRAQFYGFRRRESGIDVESAVPARDVVHLMDRGDNPGSPRGISVMAPVLRVMSQSDQLADATLATALLQTIFAATIKSPEPSADAFGAIQTLADTEMPDGFEDGPVAWADYVGALQQDLIGVWDQRINALKSGGVNLSDTARIAHIGPGEELQFLTAQTPGSNYLPFSKNLQQEVARRLGITLESYSMDHTGASYSSVRMGISSIWPIVMRRRERIAAPFAQAVYERWLEESIAEGRIPMKGGYQAFLANRQRVVWAEWQGPAKPTADDYKSAMASKLRLETGLSSLADECAEYGRDWEENATQIEREMAALAKRGIPHPFGRSTGGAGPNGMAADGNRQPAKEEA